MATVVDSLGVGWAFPFSFTDVGKVARTSDQPDGTTSNQGQSRHMYGAIIQIIMVAIGERLMRGTYGSRVHDLPFEVNDESLLGSIQYYVVDAIQRWDSRVELLDISASVDGGDLNVLIEFQIKKTGQVDALNFVFQGV